MCGDFCPIPGHNTDAKYNKLASDLSILNKFVFLSVVCGGGIKLKVCNIKHSNPLLELSEEVNKVILENINNQYHIDITPPSLCVSNPCIFKHLNLDRLEILEGVFVLQYVLSKE